MLTRLDEFFDNQDLLQSQHRGIIVDNNDPKKIGRVRCKIVGLFSSDEDSALPWCYPKLPLSMGTGSADSGSYFSPELLSEVIVEFPEGDVYHPVYTGYTLTEKSKSPLPDEGYPNTAGFVFGEMFLKFNKETNEVNFFHPSGFTFNLNSEGAANISLPSALTVSIGGECNLAITGNFSQVSSCNHTVNVAKNAVIQAEKDVQVISKKNSVSTVAGQNIISKASGSISESGLNKQESFLATHNITAPTMNRSGAVINDGAGLVTHGAGAASASPLSPPALTELNLNSVLTASTGGLTRTLSSVAGGLSGPLSQFNELAGFSDWISNPINGQVWTPLNIATGGLLSAGNFLPSGDLLSGTLTKNISSVLDGLPGGLSTMVSRLPQGFDTILDATNTTLSDITDTLIGNGSLLEPVTNIIDLVDQTTGGFVEILDVIPGGREALLNNLPEGFGGYIQTIGGGLDNLTDLIMNDVGTLIEGALERTIAESDVMDFISDLNTQLIYANGTTTSEILEYIDGITDLGIDPFDIASQGEALGDLILSGFPASDIKNYVNSIIQYGVPIERAITFASETNPKLIYETEGVDLNYIPSLLANLTSLDGFTFENPSGEGFGKLAINTNTTLDDDRTFLNSLKSLGYATNDISTFVGSIDLKGINESGLGYDSIIDVMSDLAESIGDEDLNEHLAFGSNIADFLSSGLTPKKVSNFIVRKFIDFSGLSSLSFTEKGGDRTNTTGTGFRALKQAVTESATLNSQIQSAGSVNKNFNASTSNSGDITSG